MTFEYPDSVLQRDTWPWVNRLVNSTPDRIRQRFKLWDRLRALGTDGVAKARLTSPNPSIFKGSRVHWDQLDALDEEHFSLPQSWEFRSKRERTQYTSIYGPLVHKQSIAEFTCDITELQGICNSKAEDTMHASIDDLGGVYIDEQNRLNRQGKPPLGMDEASLLEMLSHSEIRLLHRPGHDTFSIRAWDGRLFADNGGGSHHLSAAAHIAKRLGAKIPITSRLHLYQLNSKTVQWLRNDMHLVVVHSTDAMPLTGIPKGLLGTASIGPLPNSIGEAYLLAFPKGTHLADQIMQEFLAADLQDFGEELSTQLGRQEHYLAQPAHRIAGHFLNTFFNHTKFKISKAL